MTLFGRWTHRLRAVLATLAFLGAAAAFLDAAAARAGPAAAGPPAAIGEPAGWSALSPVRDIGFDQRLGELIPLEIELRDETGRLVPLREYFGRRPVILTLAYYDCPMLCGMSLQGLASALKTMTFEAGKEFEVVTVSFDPTETPDLARRRKTTYLAAYGRPQAAGAWHFLTGDEAQIRRLTAAVGFRYVWDPEQEQYAHATGLVLATPEGRIARYLFGIEYAPKDLRLGLIEAADGRIGTLADRLLLLCYHYDPRTGRYGAAALGSVRVGAVLTVLGLSVFILIMVRRERRNGS